jgi:hypothetical protein
VNKELGSLQESLQAFEKLHTIIPASPVGSAQPLHPHRALPRPRHHPPPLPPQTTACANPSVRHPVVYPAVCAACVVVVLLLLLLGGGGRLRVCARCRR